MKIRAPIALVVLLSCDLIFPYAPYGTAPGDGVRADSISPLPIDSAVPRDVDSSPKDGVADFQLVDVGPLPDHGQDLADLQSVDVGPLPDHGQDLADLQSVDVAPPPDHGQDLAADLGPGTCSGCDQNTIYCNLACDGFWVWCDTILGCMVKTLKPQDDFQCTGQYSGVTADCSICRAAASQDCHP